MFFIVILILIVIIVVTGRITKSIAVTRMVLSTLFIYHSYIRMCPEQLLWPALLCQKETARIQSSLLRFYGIREQ